MEELGTYVGGKMIREIVQEAEEKMNKTVDVLKKDLLR